MPPGLPNLGIDKNAEKYYTEGNKMRIGARCKCALTAFPDKCRGRIEQMDWKGRELVAEPPACFEKTLTG